MSRIPMPRLRADNTRRRAVVFSVGGLLGVGLGVVSLPLSSLARAADTPVKVGFARVDISTERSLTLGGYGVHVGNKEGTRKGEGIHDPLLASAVAFQGSDGRGVILVSVDSVGFSSATARRVRAEVKAALGDERVFVVLSGTHTHHAPDTMGLWGALPFSTGRDPAYMALFEALSAQAAVRAWNARVPATLSFGHTRFANSSTSKPTPAQRNDQLVALLAKDSEGRVLGTLTQWSAHPTILPERNKALSSDFVGAFRAYLDKRLPGGTHVYVNGVLGGVYPLTSPRRMPDPYPEGDKDPALADTYERVAAVGAELADATAGALQKAQPLGGTRFHGASRTVTFPLANPLFKWASGLKLIETKPRAGGIVDTEISLITLGDLTAVGVPGELFPAAAAEVSAALSAARSTSRPTGGGLVPGAPTSHPLFFGVANDWLGYVMSQGDLADPDLAYNRALSPGAECLPRLVEAVRALAAPLTRDGESAHAL